MKKEVTNKNYLATIVEVKNLVDVGLNNLVGLSAFGVQALVPKTTEIGSLMVFFPAEVQLSEDYCKNNNLYRKPELNLNKEEKGYIEENRRVKAIKLGGQYSTALAMPLHSLGYIGDEYSLKEGDKFNVLNGQEICTKYVIKINEAKERANNQRGLNKKFKKVDARMFPEHFDTENYLRNQDKVKDNEMVHVSQKLHGTSIRLSHILTNRELKWYEKLLKKLGVNVVEKEYSYVAGSRRTIKDVENENSNHFYNTDVWNHILGMYRTQIPKDIIIYGEVVGYTPDGGSIQKGYDYGQDAKTCELYVYRVATVNPDGIIVDLTFPQMKEWCKKNGFKHVPELWSGRHDSFKLVLETFQEVQYAKLNKEHREKTGQNLYIDEPIDNNRKSPEEGVCIRVDGLTPYILKMKNQSFLLNETLQLDTGVEDMESAES